MREKFKLKDVKQSLLRTCYALRFSAMFLGLALFVQLTALPDLLAQEPVKHKVTGKITAASDNSPLPGTSIKVKGSISGTVTDADVNFSVDVSDNDVLVISSIGFISEEITVAG